VNKKSQVKTKAYSATYAMDGGTKCENINEKAYAVLNMDNIHWFCGACNSVIGRVLPILTNLDMKQTKLKNELKVITVMFRM